MAFESSVTQTTIGADSVYQLRWRDTTGGGIPTFAARNFGIASATIAEWTCDWQCNDVASRSRIQFGIFRDAVGDGAMVVIERTSGWTVGVGTTPGWGFYGSVLERSAALAGLAANTWFRVHIRAVVNADNSLTVTATVRTLADVDIGSATATVNVARGDYCGVHSTFDQLGGASTASIKAINLRASGSNGYVAINTATSYVYTFVNDLGEESAPSPASATIQRPDGVTVNVVTPTATPGGTDPTYGITSKRIYRAVTGSGGTVFRKVATIPLATASFVDDLDDAELPRDVLESEDWDLPPEDLEGIMALPNGIMVGFFANQLCFSERGRPHAWPIKYRLTTDTAIVAIANIDNTVVIGTKSFVYTATGNDPSNYAMSQPGSPQACVSKASMRYLEGVGVVFASPDGYQVCNGSASSVQNGTEAIFTKRQWEALAPESIIAVVHDRVLHFFCTGPTPDRGYALDVKPNGFGLIRLSYHATAGHADPLTDKLYLVLDVNSEPTDVDLPLASSAVVPNGQTIFQFDAGASSMVYRWRGKLYLMPWPTTLKVCRVRAAAFDNLVLRVYANGVQIMKKVLTSEPAFTLPARKAYTSYEFELMGTSTVRGHQAAEDMGELT